MKILHLGKFYYPSFGGMETVLKLLADGQISLNAIVNVLCSSDNFFGSEDEIDEVKIKRLAYLGSLFSQPINPTLFFNMQKMIKSADILHLHSPNPLAELCALFLSKNQPIVLTHHSDVVRQKFLRKFYLPIYHTFLKRADQIIVPTIAHIDYSIILPEYRDKCTIIPFGININPFTLNQSMENLKKKHLKKYGKFVLFVGRLVSYKGISILLKAMKDISNNLIIVGKGPLENELKIEASQLGIRDRVHFVGKIDDDNEFMAYYHACHIFVLPSVSSNENFGMVQLEAMICKKPVITTRLKSGVPHVGEEGVSTLLAKPSDPQDLQIQIKNLLINDELALKMGENGNKLVLKKYTQEVMAKQHLDLYKKIIEKKSAGKIT